MFFIVCCHYKAKIVQWNLSVTTTSIKELLPVIYSVMCFNENWRYQFTLANSFCLLELIYVAKGHLDELQKADKYPVSVRWSLLTGFTVIQYSPQRPSWKMTALVKASKYYLFSGYNTNFAFYLINTYQFYQIIGFYSLLSFSNQMIIF